MQALVMVGMQSEGTGGAAKGKLLRKRNKRQEWRFGARLALGKKSNRPRVRPIPVHS